MKPWPPTSSGGGAGEGRSARDGTQSAPLRGFAPISHRPHSAAQPVPSPQRGRSGLGTRLCGASPTPRPALPLPESRRRSCPQRAPRGSGGQVTGLQLGCGPVRARPPTLPVPLHSRVPGAQAPLPPGDLRGVPPLRTVVSEGSGPRRVGSEARRLPHLPAPWSLRSTPPGTPRPTALHTACPRDTRTVLGLKRLLCKGPRGAGAAARGASGSPTPG